MHKALHLRDKIDRLYVLQKRGRGPTTMEDCTNASIHGFEKYTKENKERLITEASNCFGNIRTNRKTTKTRKKKWKEKQLYGYFKQQTEEIASKKTWIWIKNGNLKRETEFLTT